MDNFPRRIRSYVLREGRLTRGQQHAIDNYWGKYGIEFTPSILDLDALFNRHAPKVLEIGTGTGDFTLSIATKHPENDYIAVEVHRPGIGSLLRQVEEKKLLNIRAINHDVLDVLKFQLPDNCLDIVYVFFPDPWPKKRHHKRRLINPDFLNSLKNKLKANSRVFLATDWENYAEHILQTFESSTHFINLAGPGQYAPRPAWRPITRFEKRGQKLQHQVWDFVYMLKAGVRS